MHYSTDDVKKLGTILGIWAHPDDEVFSSAGLMKAASENGQKIISTTATYGDAGQSADENKWPKEQLADIRKAESDKALRLLGNIEQHWLGYKDGKLKEVSIDKAVENILYVIANQKIDTIITFEEQGITGHEDHKTVYVWALKLARLLKDVRVLCAVENTEFYENFGKKLHEKYNVYFNVNKPFVSSKNEVDVCLELSNTLKEAKLSALEMHASQTSGMLGTKEGVEALNSLAGCECFVFLKAV